MVSWMDEPVSPPPVLHLFTFINGYGDTRKIEAVNVTEAWIELGRIEEASTDELIERDWRVKR